MKEIVRGLGVLLALSLCCIPISCQYVIHKSPPWLTFSSDLDPELEGLTYAPPIFFTFLILFVLISILSLYCLLTDKE